MDPSPDTSTSSLSRRRILGWGGAGVIGGIAGYWSLRHLPDKSVIEASAVRTCSSAAQAPESLPDSLPAEIPSQAGVTLREDFLPHLKSVFELDSGPRCTLVEVGTAQNLVSPTAEFTAFSLLFNAPNDFAASSKIYHLTHPQMGPLDLFLSPVGRTKQGVSLEAIFSQRI